MSLFFFFSFADLIPHGKSQLYAFSFSFWASEISLQLLGPFLPKSEKPIWDYSRWGSPGWTSTFGIIANQCSSPNPWLKKWKELSGEAILVWAQLVSVKSLRNPSKMWKKMNKFAFLVGFLLTVLFFRNLVNFQAFWPFEAFEAFQAFHAFRVFQALQVFQAFQAFRAFQTFQAFLSISSFSIFTSF